MTVNRYDQAIPYEYVSQYVANPIPFQELLTLGMYYGEQRKEAEKQLSQYIKDANEFQSLIEKDVDNYYNIAFNDLIQSKINEAAADPSVMKSSAWRAGLTGALNSVNYAELSKLKKSAEQADQYDKLYKALAAEGLMPPGWEQDYYSTYDTLTDGIFDKTPLPYGSVEDVAWDFVKDMKDTYLGSHGGYNWFGVNEDMVFDQVDARKSELLANPKVQRHLQILRNAGMDEQSALLEIMNRAQTAALRRVTLKPEEDPYAKMAQQYKYNLSLAQAKSDKNDSAGAVLGKEDIMTRDFKMRSNNIVSAINESHPEFNKKYTELFTANGEVLNQNIEALRQNPEFNQMFESVYAAAIDKGLDTNTATTYALQYAASNSHGVDKEILKNIDTLFTQSGEIQNQMTDEAYGKTYQQIFNTSLGILNANKEIDLSVNPFSKIKTSKGKLTDGMFFDDPQAQHMWSKAALQIMQPLSSVSEQEINKELFGKEVAKDGQGFLIPTTRLISPKEFIFSTNQYVRDLANAADFDVLGSYLDRGSIIGGGDNKISIEERMSSGEYGDVEVTDVIGYIDTPENRNYVVRVEMNVTEDKSPFGTVMTHTFRNDDPEGMLAEAGYTIIPMQDGGSKVSVVMILPDVNMPLDKTRRNRSAQKQYGTDKTKNTQIMQDDAALNSILNYNPQEGFK